MSPVIGSSAWLQQASPWGGPGSFDPHICANIVSDHFKGAQPRTQTWMCSPLLSLCALMLGSVKRAAATRLRGQHHAVSPSSRSSAGSGSVTKQRPCFWAVGAFFITGFHRLSQITFTQKFPTILVSRILKIPSRSLKTATTEASTRVSLAPTSLRVTTWFFFSWSSSGPFKD